MRLSVLFCPFSEATPLSILKRIEYATIATVDEQGRPWNAPVYFACDEHYNIYWGSHKDSQHAQNIRANGQVFLSIYNSTVTPGTGDGVYIQAHCIELSEPADITSAHLAIQNRRSPVPYWKLHQFQGDAPIKLYRVTPERIWLNGDSSIDGTYIDTRISGEIR